MAKIHLSLYCSLTPVPLSQTTTFLPWLSITDETGFKAEIIKNILPVETIADPEASTGTRCFVN